MKRILLLLLFVAAILFSGQTASAKSITDIEDHWAKGYVKQLVDSKVMCGYPDGTFRPDSNITRAEFIKTLVKSCSYPLKAMVVPTFSDVQTCHWHYPYIETAIAAGIIVPHEYVQSRFNPDEPITRVESAMFLARSLGLQSSSSYTGFDDGNQIPRQFRGYIKAARERGLITGYPDGTFRPWNPINRAEASVILVRYAYEQGKGKGLVTISYDHQSITVYENAFPIHKAYGYPGVNYVCTSSVGSEGAMMVEQLKEMESIGWETASHTANHLHFKNITDKEIRRQLSISKEWLQQQGLTGENFAYPFRFITPNPLVEEYYSSGATSYDKEINTMPINPNKLWRYYLEYPSLEEIQVVLNKTVENGGWVIFYTHDVFKDGERPYDKKSINQDSLRLLFDEIAKRNLKVVTVKQGLEVMLGK